MLELLHNAGRGALLLPDALLETILLFAEFGEPLLELCSVPEQFDKLFLLVALLGHVTEDRGTARHIKALYITPVVP